MGKRGAAAVVSTALGEEGRKKKRACGDTASVIADSRRCVMQVRHIRMKGRGIEEDCNHRAHRE